MDTLLFEGIYLALIPSLALVGTDIAQRISTHIRCKHRRQCISHIVQLLLLPEEPDERDIIALQRIYPQRILIDAICYISSHIYGDERLRIATIVETCSLEYQLLQTAKRSRGTSHNRALFALAQLPITTNCFEYLEELIERQECLYAIIAAVASRPERAIRYCTKLQRQLSHYEVTIIADMLRIHGAPIAYIPLLRSENQKLQLIGIHLVEKLSMVDAEADIQALLSSPDTPLATHALRALCSIHGELPHNSLTSLATAMSPTQRDSFIRHAIQSCYSYRSCTTALNADERRLFRAKTDSYKCRILCN